MVKRQSKWGYPQALRWMLVAAAIAGAAWLALVPPASQATLSGRATAVDGDTLRLGGRKVRLLGIDAPEHDQTCLRNEVRWPCGKAATERLAQALLGSETSCRTHGHDRYGRILAHCRASGADLSAMMVDDGLAVARDEYLLEQTRAQAGRRGIWAGPFVDPKAWRDSQGMAEPQHNFFDWLRSRLNG